MNVAIIVPDADAVVFLNWLNDDEGLREGAVRQLLQQHKPPSIAQWTTLISVLGRISAAFAEGVEQQGLLHEMRRAQELRQLAGLPQKRAA